jgi:phosphoenolpyruvate carboxylase
VGCDVATAFYGKEVIPIFEVILPFTTDSKELVWLFNYYKKAVVGAQDIDLDGSVKVKDWIGSFKPNNIELIPLIEDMESLLKMEVDRAVFGHVMGATTDWGLRLQVRLL